MLSFPLCRYDTKPKNKKLKYLANVDSEFGKVDLDNHQNNRFAGFGLSAKPGTVLATSFDPLGQAVEIDLQAFDLKDDAYKTSQIMYRS